MNMSLYDIMKAIESTEFEAEMSVFSGFNSFLSGLEASKQVEDLLKEMSKSLDAKEKVLHRLLVLLEDKGDPNYAHPHDIPLATYLYALNHTESGLAHLAIEKMLNKPQLWWSMRLAKNIDLVQNSLTMSGELSFIHLSSYSFTTNSNSDSKFVNLARRAIQPQKIMVSNKTSAAY